MYYDHWFLNEAQLTLNNASRKRFGKDYYIPYINPQHRDPRKTDITLMVIVAHCRFCPAWCAMTGWHRPETAWVDHRCDGTKMADDATAEKNRREWVERMTRARRR